MNSHTVGRLYLIATSDGLRLQLLSNGAADGADWLLTLDDARALLSGLPRLIERIEDMAKGGSNGT
jgi:hypothetical protein